MVYVSSVFFFKQKTAYERRMSDWSSDVCSSDLLRAFDAAGVLTSRIEALEAIAAPVRGRADLTLHPTERHGFAYQSWFGFHIFVPGQGVRKSVELGKSVEVGVAIGGRSIIKKKKNTDKYLTQQV